MKNFDFHNPTRIVFGADTVAKLSTLVPHDARVLILYGGASAEKTGTLAEVRAALGQRSAHFGQGAGLFRAGAAVQDQHARIVRHQRGQFGDGIKTEDDTGGVMEFKIFHAVAPYY